MSKAFITQLLERAVKTAAQSALAIIAATQLDWFHADWKAIAGTIATATVASVLTSLCSMNIGPAGTPSVVSIEKPAA
ncbi:MAG: holin [Actinomycetes bacterium]